MDSSDSTIFREEQEKLQQKERLHQVADNIERTRHTRYRKSLVMRLIRLGGFFVLFIVLVFFLHDSMVHQQFENKMTEIGKQLQEFHQDNRRLPNLNEFLELVAGSRNLPDQLIDYDPTMVLDDSPGDTILAFTPLCRQWILPERHAVIKLDFTLIWVTADELQVMLEKRQQFYNQNSISDIS